MGEHVIPGEAVRFRAMSTSPFRLGIGGNRFKNRAIVAATSGLSGFDGFASCVARFLIFVPLNVGFPILDPRRGRVDRSDGSYMGWALPTRLFGDQIIYFVDSVR